MITSSEKPDQGIVECDAAPSVYRRPWVLIVLYALIGPFIGALVVIAGISLTTEDINASRFKELALFTLVFAYPLGLIPAITAGIVHAFTQTTLARMATIALVCTSGMTAAFLQLFVLGNPGSVFGDLYSLFAFALPSLTAALILSTLFTRPHRA